MNDYIQERTENNAGIIYKADFYPIYTQWVGKWLSSEEMIILSFIYYWTKKWNYIYATNEDLTELVGVKPRTIRKLLKRLADLWYIEVMSKTIVWMGTDRKMRYNLNIDGAAKNASPWDTGAAKNASPVKWASKAKVNGGEKIASPQEYNWEANSIGAAKNASPWGENKFVDSTLENSGKCQENGNPSEGQNLPPYKNIYKKNIFTEKISDEIFPSHSDDNNITKLNEWDNKFMFNDGSIEYYTNLVLQQKKLDDVTNTLRPLFPHLIGYKWSKKDVTKALKQFNLDYDFVHGLIYDMKLLSRWIEAKLTKRQWFMSQRIDTYTPYTEKQREAIIVKVITFIKRNNKDRELFQQRAQDFSKLIWVDKYRRIFKSIPANPEDRVDLSGMS